MGAVRCVVAAAVGTAVGVGMGIAVWESDGVGVWVGVRVGARYGVAVGAAANAPTAGVAVSASGALGPVQASTTDAAATRATIAPVMATVIELLLVAFLGCLSRGFMTRKCYKTRERDACRCHNATTGGGRNADNPGRKHRVQPRSRR